MVPARAPTATSTELLEGLKDPANATVWREYVERYREVILRTVRRAGFSESDAEDVAQNALVDFATAYRGGGYDRERGRLRSWLFGIVRNRVRRGRAERGERPEAGESALELAPAADAFESLWDDEWRGAVLRRALEVVRAEIEERTFEAFRRFALEERPAADVARELGLSSNAVFLAKRRVVERLREVLPLVDDTW